MRKFVHWQFLLVLSALIVAAIIPTTLKIQQATGAYASGGTTITLSASTGQPGAAIQVSGKGFTPSQSVTLYLGSASGTLLATATTDASGNLPSTNITVPDQPGGANTIIAVQGKVAAQAAFTIVPLISLSKTALSPGQTTTLTAKGFAANSAVVSIFTSMAITSRRTRRSISSGIINILDSSYWLKRNAASIPLA